ncbi:LOW QUALITY PROTEIN: headcase protein homolog [Branchiostoma floridae]|uniref:LOW QUALITY PROTEIN: headcase protein homolog n=1 Tax=Branchiostoma floridae TaxID=7739 RepID=A0A9J7KKS2_BRAFL|nr:LOW QUALITY PROTEIN: headcase protein homolog [Branchiostoma floridae]
MPHRGERGRNRSGNAGGEGDRAGQDNNNHEFWCCVPGSSGCQLGSPVSLANPEDVVKVVCNHDGCPEGPYMHKQCFEEWEETVLTFLRSSGRARSWSEKQRRQNLWTKKGYDLAYRACACKCGKGHLRKDLNWIPVKPTAERAVVDNEPAAHEKTEEEEKERQTRSWEGSPEPTPLRACERSPPPGLFLLHPLRHQPGSTPPNAAMDYAPSPSPPWESTPSPRRSRTESQSSDNNSGNYYYNASMFTKRLDLSLLYSVLPPDKLNPIHIKMEDEGHADDTRQFVLSNLTAYRVSTIPCVLCNTQLPVFDRYPLVDGTLFLTPQDYNAQSIRVFVGGRWLYLSAVCVHCLMGIQTCVVCKNCNARWDGSSHQLGTMYTYDILAANPCCPHRVSCKACGKPVRDPSEGTHFYSEYSTSVQCPHCGVPDYHFIKPLSTFKQVSDGLAC